MSTGLPHLGVRKIVSGGQTGVDQAALEAAISLGLDHGGWCPRNRLSESGRIPSRFRLQETHSAEYWVRTEQNVIDSDATLILYRGELRGGTAMTHRMATKHRRPYLLVDLAQSRTIAPVSDWLQLLAVKILNVAGPRESSCPGIQQEAQAFLRNVFLGQENSVE